MVEMLSQKNTSQELEFLKKLISFMERKGTPIERPPMLGFKQSMKFKSNPFLGKISNLAFP